uniref:NADH-ubiquinone oxidoreductase chain 2 n=2 Tax=unclassified Megaspilidae TaxID=1253067 RepID=A0A3Q8UA66_9HYME|nr:NADH dehydrogenase subunit 2 [Megaspilidae sp. SJW-2015]AZL93347.1 NADH dehydrogenase subunit 2 [Megaspilidae sp. ZJUH_2016022]
MKLMINKSNYLMFIFVPILLLSIMLSLSSSSWLMSWMLIELNLMSFIPIMQNYTKFLYCSNNIKYYLIQTFSSVILLFSLNFSLMNYFLYFKNIVFISMFMKLGMPPFHMWFVNLMKNNSWIICMYLSSLQKIIPLIILIFLDASASSMNMILIILLIYYFFMINPKFLNSLNFKLIMSYSSIINTFWIVSISMYNPMWSIFYMMIYFTSSVNLMMMMNLLNSKNFNNLMMKILNNWNYTLMVLTFIVAALPPTNLFMMKYMLMNLNMNNMLLLIFLTFISTISILVYFRFIMNSMFLKKFTNKINIMNFININFMKKKLNFLLIMNFLINLNTLTITPIIMTVME